MILQVPNYFKPTFDAYQKTGTLSAPTQKLDYDSPSEVRDNLSRSEDSFTRWQILDEGPDDLFKGRPGEVRTIRGDYSIEAYFEGTSKQGRLLEVDHNPQHHYGYEFTTLTNFSSSAVEVVSYAHCATPGADLDLGAELIHLNRENPEQSYILSEKRV